MCSAWCDICADAMGRGPWAMGFKRCACGGHYVVIGAARLAGYAGMGGCSAWCDICAVAMRRALCGMHFKRCAARHCVVIGAARLAGFAGI